MNDSDLSQIEQNLALTLPTVFRELIDSRSKELVEVGCFDDDFSPLFVNADKFTRYNLIEREKDAGTEYAFPKWWETFVLIGTNGGGDYYTLRLDNAPGVWMIGSDCGDEPTLVADSLTKYVNELIADHESELKRQAEVEQRRLPYQAEIAAHREAIANNGGPEDAIEWLDIMSGYPMFRMLDRLPRKVSPRKLRLYGIACCRLIPSISKDKHCIAALEVAERMTLGEATEEEVSATRDRMRERRNVQSIERIAQYLLKWRSTAVHHLFQEDDHYLKDSPIYPNDPKLTEVYNACSYAVHQTPYGTDVELDLLREVLGNPFLPVEFQDGWRTEEVVGLAASMFDRQDFTDMPQLAEALSAAGCDDDRVIAHCQREVGHVRGCWVLDLILQHEPMPDDAFTWDFQCQHPTIDGAALKERLQAFGTRGEQDRSKDGYVLSFADWLDEQGDADWAEYVRVRCALDGKPPGDDYIDLIERQFECGAGMRPKLVEFENIYFSGYRFADDKWWEEETDDFERGLPSLVQAVTASKDPCPPELLKQRLRALVENTPVRGMDFDEHYADAMEEILNSPAGEELRYMAFENRASQGETSPVLKALAQAPGAPLIERLSIENGINSDGDAQTLAKSFLENLHRLDMQYGRIDCSAAAAESLMTAGWFPQLGQLRCGFDKQCAEVAMQFLSQLPNLHSLALLKPCDATILPAPDVDEFAALRRLHISGAKLSSDAWKALSNLRAPRLIDLWLARCEGEEADIQALIESPLTENLLALTFAGPRLNEASIDGLARSRCAAQLRVLRLRCGDHDLIGSFRSLSATALAGDAFANLTTLQVEYPYADGATRDTAELLRKLSTPKLRHLTLKDCDFDDECAAALTENPSFSHLTRLQIDQGYGKAPQLSVSTVASMLRSTNLQNLVEIDLNQFPLGGALGVFADQAVLPNLKTGAVWGSRSPESVKALIESERPIIHVGS